MGVAVSAAAVITVATTSTASAADAGTQIDEVSELFADALAADLGPWAIDEVHPVRHGSITVVMRTPTGDRFHVEVLRRDPALAGVAESDAFSLFLANRGDGETMTAEDEGRGAQRLAAYLRGREQRLAAAGGALPALLTHGERLRAFPDGRFFPRA